MLELGSDHLIHTMQIFRCLPRRRPGFYLNFLTSRAAPHFFFEGGRGTDIPPVFEIKYSWNAATLSQWHGSCDYSGRVEHLYQRGNGPQSQTYLLPNHHKGCLLILALGQQVSHSRVSGSVITNTGPRCPHNQKPWRGAPTVVLPSSSPVSHSFWIQNFTM